MLHLRPSARVVSVGQKEHHNILPRPGWVEHDAREIWANVLEVVGDALDSAQLEPSDLVALGITNQRETTVVWDRATGEPLHNAITWQDTRTDRLVRELAEGRGQDRFREQCGLPLAHLLLRPQAALAARQGAGPARARRDRRGAVRDGRLLAHLEPDRPARDRRDQRVPDDADEPPHARLGRRAAGRVRGAAGDVAGDPLVVGGLRPRRGAGRRAGRGGARRPEAALFGQTCFTAGDAKCTYGTGSFLLLNTGDEPVQSTHGLLTTVGYKIGDRPASYALEGSIAVTGALVQWLRDNLEPDRQRTGDRDAREDGRGQRWLLLRARVLRACSHRTGAATRAASSPA